MKKAIELLTDFLESSGVSVSAVARALGVSVSAISQFRKGEYKGDNAKLAKKLISYIEDYKEKAENRANRSEDEVFVSFDYKMANFIINEAVAEREIALIYGSAGTGKTTILKEFAKNHANAILIEVTPHTTPRVLLEDLCEALKITAPKALRAMLKAVAKYLSVSDKIILIDEAEHLPLKALEDLRRIVDFSKTPLVLCGTEILLRNLMGKNKELRQLYSRICGKHVMSGLSKKESKEFFGDFIYEFAKENFRSSAKLHKKAMRLAEINGAKKISREMVEKATSMVVLG